MNRSKTLKFAQLAILSAILFIMAFTPLGTLGPLAITIAQVPVVIGACTLGKKEGVILGGVFGLFSMISFLSINAAHPIAFIFNPFVSFSIADSTIFGIIFSIVSVVVCFVPRILIGVVSGTVFEKLENKNEALAYILSGVLGALTNTVLVLGIVAAVFIPLGSHMTGLKPGAAVAFVTGSLTINAVCEVIITPILSYAISKPVNYYVNKRK